MTEIETTLPGRRITAGPTELYIEDTEWSGRRIRTKLRGDDAKKVAEALDPGRGTYPSGSHADEMARAIDRLTAERDEANARAEQAESELKPSSPLRQQADSWMRIANHPAISQSLSEKNKSYSDQVFERITWLFEAAEDARESNPAPTVSRADIEKAVRIVLCGNPDALSVRAQAITDAVWSLVSGDDPAVFVVRESDIAAVEVERVDAQWNADGALMAWTGESAEEVRGQNANALRNLAHREAVARAIEAEQAVDPVEAKAIELHQVAYGGRIGFGHANLNAQEMFRILARHVLGQEADHA